MPWRINSQEIQGGTFNDIGRDQTNNAYHGVVGHHVQIDSMSVTCSHGGQAPVERTMYDEFRQVLLGDVMALQNIHHEDLSQYEWQLREGRILGRSKARVTTQIVQLFSCGDSKFTVVRYEGDDAKKVWKTDFQKFSEIREPGSPQLFAINTSKIPMLIFHHTERTPVTSMKVEDLDNFLWRLSWNFDDLIRRIDDHDWGRWLPIVRNLPDGMQGPMEQLDLSRQHLQNGSIPRPKEWDQALQQHLHFFHAWGLEIDSEAGEKDFEKWVRVKDSGSIQESDDDDEDFLNTTPSSFIKFNSRTQNDDDIRTSTRCNHNITSDHPMNTDSDDCPSMVPHPAPHSPRFTKDGSSYKHNRSNSASNATQESFARIRANKRFKPASAKKQQLLENARKRPGLRGRKHSH